MKAVVAAFNQEKALVGAFSVIIQLHRLIDLRHYLLPSKNRNFMAPNLIVIPLLVAGDRPEHRGDSPAAAGPGSVQVLGQYRILSPDWWIITILLSSDWLIVTILSCDWCRYSVKSANQETSSTLQPFYTLQLDIQVSLCYTLLARRHFDIQTYFFRMRTS